MQVQLEKATLDNIQLQESMREISVELGRLMKENDDLKASAAT